MHIRRPLSPARLGLPLAQGAALLLTLTAPAQAQQTDGTAKPQADWSFMVGAGAGYRPEYEGSKHYEFGGLPMLGITWRDTVSLGVEGLKVTLHPLADRGLTIGGGIGYWQGRKEGADKDHDDLLRGLGNLDGNATGNVTLGYDAGPLFSRLKVERDLGGDRDGLTMKLTGGAQVAQWDKLKVSAGVSTTWADDNFMASMFGVSAQQSARSPRRLASYDAAAGFKDVGTFVRAEYTLTPSIALNANLTYDRLVGDAADSPIVTSDNQFGLMMGMAYKF